MEEKKYWTLLKTKTVGNLIKYLGGIIPAVIGGVSIYHNQGIKDWKTAGAILGGAWLYSLGSYVESEINNQIQLNLIEDLNKKRLEEKVK